ncbi:hypothetical protein A946_00420 [Methylacidiphilum kamchatkense Kam1]|uniref:Uncharacterized protein n=1 Tax=Methylacidiphilum kamchatkense Kam1 TaxID=1202785 RepID=A0A0C1UTZ1_9BACT|nr:hypothetical protein [Methylacidiphilum kamchatkense]KIE59233.1 hypothetical protein A946_00420 [Methylacidiphilum kamchatkense Kam1]QDQ42807.1 hypothetical protein kam1_1592 [Methylacidiphilum kamchatkense Kam1]
MPTYFIWNSISEELSHQILLCAQQSDKKLYRLLLDMVSKGFGIRINKLLEMPKIKRHALCKKVLSHPRSETMSFYLLSHWLIETQSPMLCRWLDMLGIAHDEKGILEVDPEEPPLETLQQAVNTLFEEFPKEYVSIYLQGFYEMEGVKWKNLGSLMANDPRFKIGTYQPVT